MASSSYSVSIYQAWLRLGFVLCFAVSFAWFGPTGLDQISKWFGSSGGWVGFGGTAVASNSAKLAPDFGQWLANWQLSAKTSEWFQGLNVTPIAGQSAVGANQGSTADQAAAQVQPTAVPTPVPYVPPINENLPQGRWLVIPKIGVRSELQKNPDYETALERGLWQVPDYGDPGSRDLPMIVAGHRFGWDWWWKSDYWKYHSFYKLPELAIGDRVEVIADQRKWVYEIYAAEEGTQISDYSGDLILYTCKHLKSPIRYFRYARLIDPTADSQR